MKLPSSTVRGGKLPVTDNPSATETLAVVAARTLAQEKIVFAGHGLPTLAVALARETVSPDCAVIYESGVVGAHPESLPLSISDSVLVSGAEGVLTMPTLFGGILQGGRAGIGFLGAAQIDRQGSLNSTLIGSWDTPRVKLPGSGGAVEIMANAREVFVIMRKHTTATFVEQLDFVTSPSPLRAHDPGVAKPQGAGVTKVFTEFGLLSMVGGELTLTGIHPDVEPERVLANTGWELAIAENLTIIEPPTTEELALLRDLDPDRVYLR
ncbi:CoA-transferase subunit beta [Ornithinimicrobium cryptoxanthini]|uniref:CoA-transferase subunit beta n=1 Tax=Ornithinimicrobium cryptoxanthini TaxID=2934161 RepID=UPI002117BEC8|nr:CoA-transferase [Ornithinimicrobium cryptoxanthini]